jgi:hypothetical protein
MNGPLNLDFKLKVMRPAARASVCGFKLLVGSLRVGWLAGSGLLLGWARWGSGPWGACDQASRAAPNWAATQALERRGSDAEWRLIT